MSLKFDPRSDAENKKSDVGRNQLDNYKNKEKITAHSEHVLSSLPEDGSWIQMKDLYPKYKDKVENPLHRQTVANVLTDFDKIGEVEKIRRGTYTKYRKADRPVEAIRKGFNRHSVDLPPWIMERVEKVVEKEVERKVEKHLERRAEEFRQRILSQDEKLKRQTLEDTINDRQELLVEIINKKEAIKSKELYKEFYEQYDLDRDLSQRTLRNYLRDLTGKGLIDKQGSGRWTEYKAV